MKSIFKHKPRNTEMSKLIDVLNETKDKLDAANNRYDYLTDPDMIDSAIFEIESLTAKYRLLIKDIKRYSDKEAV